MHLSLASIFGDAAPNARMRTQRNRPFGETGITPKRSGRAGRLWNISPRRQDGAGIALGLRTVESGLAGPIARQWCSRDARPERRLGHSRAGVPISQALWRPGMSCWRRCRLARRSRWTGPCPRCPQNQGGGCKRCDPSAIAVSWRLKAAWLPRTLGGILAGEARMSTFPRGSR